MPLNFPHTIHRTASPQVRNVRSGKHVTQLAGHLGAGALGDAASDYAAALSPDGSAPGTAPTTPATTDPNAINWGNVSSSLLTAGGSVATNLLQQKFGTPAAAPKPAAAPAASSMMPIVLGLGALGLVGYLIMRGHKGSAA